MIVSLRKAALLFLITISSITSAFAQSRIPTFEIGVVGGGTVYHGDLTQYMMGDRKSPGYSGTFFFNRQIFSNLYFRGNITGGIIKGDDGKYSQPNYDRNVKFETPFIEVAGLLYQPVLTYDQSRTIMNTLYLMGGAGYTLLDHNIDYSQTRLQGGDPQRTNFRGDEGAEKPNSIPVILAGLGIRRTLSTKLDITAEFMHRFTNTDFLDGVSYSGDDTKNDSYHTISVGLIYTFNSDNRRNHYDFRRRGRNKIYCPSFW